MFVSVAAQHDGGGCELACFKPKVAWLPEFDHGDGLRPVFRRPLSGGFSESRLWCRECEGCRLDRARDKAIQVSHEAMLYDRNCFVTLTYDQANLPFRGMLVEAHARQFLKDLRNRFRGLEIKHLTVGEYGGRTVRPHYHSCLCGVWFDDSRPAGKSKTGYPQWTSKMLDGIWGKGQCWINQMSSEVAEYAARYSLKKVGDTSGLDRVDLRTGEPFTLPPVFDFSSKTLGKRWLEVRD